MDGTDLPRRRFITRAAVEDTARAGGSITLGARDVLTDEAATRARDLGVTIVRPGRTGGGSGTGAGARGGGGSGTATVAATGARVSAARTPAVTSSPPQRSADGTAPAPGALRAALRAAVVAELGTTDPRLDGIIDAVLARRGLA